MSTPRTQTLVVERELAGVRLRDLLARAAPAAHRADLRGLLAAGAVRVNGAACLSDRRLRVGDVVEVRAEVSQRPARAPDASLEVLAETASVLVVAKPAGLPTVPDRSGRQRGVHGLLEALRPRDDLRIVHRLDRDTSGCLLLAKGLAAARHFDAQFRAGRIAKTYVALVSGVPSPSPRRIDAWLGPDPRRPGKVVAAAGPRPGFREAHTEIALRRAFRRYALVELRPATGRGHQLRVHLQSIGHPIVGDRDYGGEALLLSRLKAEYKLRPGVDEQPLLRRLFLHAERVRFDDVDGAPLDVEAPLPSDLAIALRHLEKQQSLRSPTCD